MYSSRQLQVLLKALMFDWYSPTPLFPVPLVMLIVTFVHPMNSPQSSRPQREKSLKMLQSVAQFGDGSHHTQTIWNQFDLCQYSLTCFPQFYSGCVSCATAFAIWLQHAFPVETEAQKRPLPQCHLFLSVDQRMNVFLCFLSTSNATRKLFSITLQDTLCLCLFGFCPLMLLQLLIKLALCQGMLLLRRIWK